MTLCKHKQYDQREGPRHETVVSSSNSRKTRPKLLRRITFQEESANALAQSVYQIDVGGHPVLSPTNNFAFQFSPVKKVPEMNMS